jgi:hypothetical protein
MLYARCYGADPRTAWALDRALVAALHTKKFGPVKMALLNAPGQLLAESEPSLMTQAARRQHQIRKNNVSETTLL